MSEDLIKIPVGGKIIVLKGSDWDSDIEIDEVAQIQYDNLFGEIVTVSSLYNRVGLLKADVDNEYEEYKLDCQVFESQVRQQYIKSKIAMGEKKPTVDDCEDHLNTHPEVMQKRKRLLQLKKNCNYIDALYWAVQSKDKKLSVLMKGVTPEEFAKGILERRVNTFLVKKFNEKL